MRHFFIFALFASFLFFSHLASGESRIFDEVTGIDYMGNIQRLKIEKPKVILSKREIYHHEILSVYLYGASALEQERLNMRVYRNGQIRLSADIELHIPFLIDDEGDQERLKAVYLPGWNEEEGKHEIHVYYGEKRIDVDGENGFLLKRREVQPLGKFLTVVDLEMNDSIRKRRYVDPDGQETDYRAILKWAQFMEVDAIWVLSGETTSFSPQRNSVGPVNFGLADFSPQDQSSLDTGPLDTGPWDTGPLENLRLLKEIAGEYGIQVGAYIMCFYVPGKHGIPEMYTAGIGYNSETDSLYRSHHISLISEKRIQDIIDLARMFQKDQKIDYIGFDFIRTGRADGYELGPLVVKDTNIITPVSWNSLSEREKIKWFARKVEVERDPVIIEKWQWWRAHRVAQIVQRVIDEARITKPVWVYTLGWNHGKEHGQDPVMFFDAGVSIDAVMLYEANRQQFERLLKQWNSYIRNEQGNIIIGNCIDYRLLDSETLTPPEELGRRNVEGYSRIIRNGWPTGLFLHDISRAFWGRRGGYTIEEYALSFLYSVRGLKSKQKAKEIIVEGVLTDVMEDSFGQIEFTGYLIFMNRGEIPLKRIRVSFFDGDTNRNVVFYQNGKSTFSSAFEIGPMEIEEQKRLEFSLVHRDEGTEMNRIGFKIEIEDTGENRIITLNDLKSVVSNR